MSKSDLDFLKIMFDIQPVESTFRLFIRIDRKQYWLYIFASYSFINLKQLDIIYSRLSLSAWAYLASY